MSVINLIIRHGNMQEWIQAGNFRGGGGYSRGNKRDFKGHFPPGSATDILFYSPDIQMQDRSILFLSCHSVVLSKT